MSESYWDTQEREVQESMRRDRERQRRAQEQEAEVVDVSEAEIDAEYPVPPEKPPVKIIDGVRDTARR